MNRNYKCIISLKQKKKLDDNERAAAHVETKQKQ